MVPLIDRQKWISPASRVLSFLLLCFAHFKALPNLYTKSKRLISREGLLQNTLSDPGPAEAISRVSMSKVSRTHIYGFPP
jgi:hypothetical protein